jgi:hypothetical protein
MQSARVKGYTKDPSTGDIILVAYPINEQGKPIDMTPECAMDIQIRFSQDALQKLIREEMPTEEKIVQELLDKIHGIRTERVLNVLKIDERIETLQKEANKDFAACKNKFEVMKTAGAYRFQISLLTQKRHVARFSIQEESELSLRLAKLRASALNSER